MKRAEGAFLLFTSPQKSKRKDAKTALDSVAAKVAKGSLTTASLQPPLLALRGWGVAAPLPLFRSKT
jgi:hypothetical protein